MGRYISPILRKLVYKRDSYSCRYCSKKLEQGKGELSLDHVVPRCKGGPHTMENLVTSCPQCQWKKGSKYLHETTLKLTELVI